ncbi:MAG: DUF3429 domain-containing protein [Hyphomicrobiales bacterium]|nr:DUF3429 domain-containing protein [Hyphomicrobiales bacterium]
MTVLLPRGSDRIPSAALWLGLAGLVPFVGSLIVLVFMPEFEGGRVGRVITVYGAIILSFLGGMLWGLASAALGHDPLDGDSKRLLTLSAMPPVVAWLAVFLAQSAAFWVLALAFALVLILDRWADQLDLAPRWWMRLRIGLTAAVMGCLITLALFGRHV